MRRVTNTKRVVLIISVVILTIALLLGGLYYFRSGPKISPEAQNKALEILAGTTKESSLRQITSNYGISVNYDPELIDAEGLVQTNETGAGGFQGETYTDTELDEARNYSIINLRLPAVEASGGDDKTDSEESGIPKYKPVNSYMAVSTNRLNSYFDGIEKVPGYENLSRLEALAKNKRDSIQKSKPNSKIEESTVKLGGTTYTLLKVDNYFSALGEHNILSSTDYLYMTVQNDRPYWLSIYGIVAQQSRQLDAWQSIVATAKYENPKDGALAGGGATATLASAQKTDTAYIRGNISPSAMVNIVAKNQIATVRVASMRCVDISYTLAGKSIAFTNVCNGGIGSGSIVSTDGVVATNGHVTSVSDDDLLATAVPNNSEEWAAYAEFLVTAGYLTQQQVDALMQRAYGGDQESIAHLLGYAQVIPKSATKPSNDRRSFIVQLADDPIRAAPGFRAWTYTQTNVSATLIDEEVDLDTNGFKQSSPYTDVALLKISGTYPTVSVSTMAGVSSGDPLVAIGFPAVVDNGIDTTAQKTVPTVSGGTITQKIKAGGDHVVTYSTAQISSGNSGGPAFNSRGQQIGLNTYAGIPEACSKESATTDDCFGNAVVRDSQGVISMASKNKVNLAAGGELTRLWHQGMDEFLAGKYSAAAATLTSLDSKYPGNYLVVKFRDAAKAEPRDGAPSGGVGPTEINGGSDEYTFDHDAYAYESSYDSLYADEAAVGVVAVILIVVIFVLIPVGVIVLLVVFARKHSAKKAAQVPYYAPTATPPAPAYAPAPQPGYAPAPPQSVQSVAPPAYTQQAPAPTYTQQPPAPTYAQQAPVPVYGQPSQPTPSSVASVPTNPIQPALQPVQQYGAPVPPAPQYGTPASPVSPAQPQTGADPEAPSGPTV